MAVSRSQKSVLATSLPYAVYGVLAGIVGGIAILLVWWLAAGSGIVQALAGIAQATTRTTSPVVGFIAHIVISIIIIAEGSEYVHTLTLSQFIAGELRIC